MSVMQDRYTYFVSWSESDNEYLGLCEELPHLTWFGDTPEAAFQGIRNVVTETISEMAATGIPVPLPVELG